MRHKQTTLSAQRINNVIDQIRHHLDDELDVAGLSGLAHFSPLSFPSTVFLVHRP